MSIGAELLRYNKTQKYCIFDFETEGLSLGRSRPWQSSFIIVQDSSILEEHNDYVWWADLAVSQGAAIVTHFNYEDYKGKAKPAKEIYDKWASYIYDPQYICMGHNILGYDSMLAGTWARGIGAKPDYSWMIRSIDTNCISKAVKKGFKPEKSSPQAFLSWQLKLSSYVERGLKTNLTAMSKENKIEFDYATLHDGLQDIKLNNLLWDKLKWQIEI